MPKTIETLTDEECTALLTTLRLAHHFELHPRAPLRNYTMALLMLDAGLRASEVTKLRQGCVFFEDTPLNSVIVPERIAKNKLERAIPMTERLQAAIKEMQNRYWQPDKCPALGHCFYLKDWDKPITVRQLQRIIHAAAKIALRKPVWPHMLRHTFATRLMRKTNIRIVQQLLGHKSLSSTQIYTHPNNQDLKKAITEIEN